MQLVTLISIILIFSTITIGIVLCFVKRFNISWLFSISFILIFIIQGIFEPSIFKQSINMVDMISGGNTSAFFLHELGFSPNLFFNYFSQYFYTPITSLFVHGHLLHLFMNTIFMLLLGPFLEKKIGRPRFLILFFVSGIFGSFLTAALGFFDLFYISWNTVGFGASGSLFGIMGCFFFLYPNDRIRYFFNLPIWSFVLLYFLFNAFMFMLTMNNDESRVGYDVHMGGLIGGILVGVVYKFTMDVKITAKKKADVEEIRSLARTKRLKDILKKIENEDESQIQDVWLEEFGKNLKCSKCGRKDISFSKTKFVCKCGNKIKVKE